MDFHTDHPRRSMPLAQEPGSYKATIYNIRTVDGCNSKIWIARDAVGENRTLIVAAPMNPAPTPPPDSQFSA